MEGPREDEEELRGGGGGSPRPESGRRGPDMDVRSGTVATLKMTVAIVPHLEKQICLTVATSKGEVATVRRLDFRLGHRRSVRSSSNWCLQGVWGLLVAMGASVGAQGGRKREFEGGSYLGFAGRRCEWVHRDRGEAGIPNPASDRQKGGALEGFVKVEWMEGLREKRRKKEWGREKVS